MALHYSPQLQFAALPVFTNPDGGLEIGLVTTRGGGRWLIPKGNPIMGLAPHEVAAREALEEAGLSGVTDPLSIGAFEFTRKRHGREENFPVHVHVLKVERQLPAWTEMHQRSFLRCSIETATLLVSAPGLARLIGLHAWRNTGAAAPAIRDRHAPRCAGRSP